MNTIEVSIQDTPATREFFSMTSSDKTEVIRYGLDVRKAAELSYQKWSDKDWAAKFEAQADELQAKVRSLELENNQFKLDATKLPSLCDDTIAAVVESAVKSERARYESQITMLSEHNFKLQTQLAETSASFEERLHSRMTEIVATHSTQVTQLNIMLQKEREQTRERELSASKSTEKGKEGEVYVQGQLTMLFPCAEIEDTRSESHRGDFVVRNEGVTMMVESKNYKRNVQKAEIDKFYRDIDNRQNAEFDCAILVSLSSGICNRADFCFEVRNDVPIIFLHNVAASFQHVRLAHSFFKMLKTQDGVDLSCKQVRDAFRHVATVLKRSMGKQKTALDKYYSTQLALIGDQQSALETLFLTAKLPF